MSDSEKRKAISVYLTPRASMILRDYNEGSGYGSISRTVEEIILAFDSTYKTVEDAFRTLQKHANTKPQMTDEEKVSFFLFFYSKLQNIRNAISRLEPANPSV